MLEKHHETPFWNASFCWKGVFFHETTQSTLQGETRNTMKHHRNTIEARDQRNTSNTCFHFFVFFSVFPKIVVPQNGWFIMEIPDLKWMIWGRENPLFSETFFFSVFHWSLAQLRWWPPALWYPWVRCLTGGVWDQVQKISEEEKTWLEKSRVKKREITKHICAYIVYILYVSICMMI